MRPFSRKELFDRDDRLAFEKNRQVIAVPDLPNLGSRNQPAHLSDVRFFDHVPFRMEDEHARYNAAQFLGRDSDVFEHQLEPHDGFSGGKAQLPEYLKCFYSGSSESERSFCGAADQIVRGDRDQLGEELRLLFGEEQGDIAAIAVADDGRLGNALCPAQLDYVIAVPFDAVFGVGGDGLAMTPAVDGDGTEHRKIDLLVLAELSFTCRVSVQKDECRTRSVFPVGDFHSPEVKIFCCQIFHFLDRLDVIECQCSPKLHSVFLHFVQLAKSFSDRLPGDESKFVTKGLLHFGGLVIAFFGRQPIGQLGSSCSISRIAYTAPLNSKRKKVERPRSLYFVPHEPRRHTNAPIFVAPLQRAMAFFSSY